MALIVRDRVKDATTTTGTGTLTLSGATIAGYRPFNAVLATNDTVYYAVTNMVSPTNIEWEVGLGTYTAANTLARTTVLASSNANAAVNLSAGTKEVFLTAAATTLRGITSIVDNENTVTNIAPGSQLALVTDGYDPGQLNAVPAYLETNNSPIEDSTPVIRLVHTTSGVTAGSFTNANITVDEFGRVRAASSGAGGGSGTVNTAVTRTAPTASASTALTTIQSYPVAAGEITAGSEYEFKASLRVINTTAASNAVVTLSVGATNVLVLTQAIGGTAAAAPGAAVTIEGRITFYSTTQAECRILAIKQAAVAFTALANTSAPITVAAAGATTIDLKFNTSAATSTFIARQASIQRVK